MVAKSLATNASMMALFLNLVSSSNCLSKCMSEPRKANTASPSSSLHHAQTFSNIRKLIPLPLDPQ
ncbi:hypothetical protein OSB04_006419 [Centaurea solstitialis]|uniref:Secreted protein n=1 Tax=Centaurea solstitialis TaxID=347529 RepID=A0AA38WS03_9ASTR|nr:hypothetical protein OSB04_006419 [Centaurea solstitialis]